MYILLRQVQKLKMFVIKQKFLVEPPKCVLHHNRHNVNNGFLYLLFILSSDMMTCL